MHTICQRLFFQISGIVFQFIFRFIWLNARTLVIKNEKPFLDFFSRAAWAKPLIFSLRCLCVSSAVFTCLNVDTVVIKFF